MATERTVVKKVSNGVLYSDGTIRLDNVRLSFPFIGTPAEDEDDDGNTKKKYRLVAMLPKKTHTELKDLIKAEIQKLLTDNEAKVPNENWCLRDGDKQAEGDDKKEVYAGHFTLTASETRRVTARKRNGEVMTAEEADEAFYGGCWANVLIRLWYFNGKSKNSKKSFPKRISGGLVSVQFVRDDEPFGQGRISDEGVFEAVEDDGTDGMGGDDDL